DYKKPLLLTLYKNLSSYFSQNIKNLIRPAFLTKGAIQCRLEHASTNIEDGFTYNQKEQITGDHQRFFDNSGFGDHARKKQPVKTAIQKKYKKKKGILSLNIIIPKEGNSLSANKLWGNSSLSLIFISKAWKKTLILFSIFLFVGLGFYLKKKMIMTPFSFLISTFLL
ncbi:MAG: hypothetical protein KAJ14_12610, partial [Candidatus Omnitrophica bacterium]|nr:hypothetical protein [Candidatus Omnitrophota bacterium]